jgi:hypothetical protein
MRRVFSSSYSSDEVLDFCALGVFSLLLGAVRRRALARGGESRFPEHVETGRAIERVAYLFEALALELAEALRTPVSQRAPSQW